MPKHKTWSLDRLMGYQDGLNKGIEIHLQSIQTYRATVAEFDGALDTALTQGFGALIRELDDLILKRIESGDTPKKH